MKTSLFCPLQPRTSWLMLVADGGWGMLPITMYARTKWLTKLAVFTYPLGEQSILQTFRMRNFQFRFLQKPWKRQFPRRVCAVWRH